MATTTDPARKVLMSEHVAGALRRHCPYNASRSVADILDGLRREVDELADAIEGGASWEIEEEFGDTLFAMASLVSALADRHRVSVASADHRAAEKMVARHPYVFADAPDPGPERAVQQWDELKRNEESAALAARCALLVVGTVTLSNGHFDQRSVQRTSAVLTSPSAGARTGVRPASLLYGHDELGSGSAIACAVAGSPVLGFVSVRPPDEHPVDVRQRWSKLLGAGVSAAWYEVPR